jgi:hypothetical protein
VSETDVPARAYKRRPLVVGVLRCPLKYALADAHLRRDDVELLGAVHADLAQHCAVVRAHALVFGQLVAHHLARQGGVERLAPAGLAHLHCNEG